MSTRIPPVTVHLTWAEAELVERALFDVSKYSFIDARRRGILTRAHDKVRNSLRAATS